LCWHSLRSAFGIRRGVKAKIVPVIVFVIMCVPAVVNAVAVDLNSAHARIGRIGGDFGISVVVASHLLGEVEQICDHLIAIDGGRLLRAASITSFTTASQVLAIEVDEGIEALAAELARRGLHPVPAERELLVPITSAATFDAVRDAVADLGLPLNRMEQRRHRVEELFRAPAEPAELGGALAADGRA